MLEHEKTNQKLRCFPIHLRNLTDLRRYCSLLDFFSFDGYIRYKDRKIQKDDIIALLSCCSDTEIILCVYYDYSYTCRGLAELLKNSGLSD